MVASKAEVSNLSSYGVARSTIAGAPLNEDEARQTHAFWRACNYLALGMIYLQDNPLLREPLKPGHIKNRMLGHWGASPALSFIYTHLNRVIKKFDREMIFMAGPGHGAPGVRLAYNRTNHGNLHVRGYKERGNINTPLELAIENEIDRFTLAIDVIDRVPKLQTVGAHAKEKFRNLQIACRHHAHEHGIDKPEIVEWRWPF